METTSPSFILTLAAFIGGFSVLVFIHEWGHYIVGRLFGVKADVFSIGFGKELFGWTSKKTGTRWRISAIPLGGYVKFYGDASEASNAGAGVDTMTDAEKAVCLHHKPLWQRALVVAAGPLINLIVPIFVFAGFVYVNGSSFFEPVIAEVQKGSSAEAAGLKAGDRFVSINGSAIEKFSDLGAHVRIHPGMPLDFKIERSDGSIVTMTISPGVKYMEDRFGRKYSYGQLGVTAREGRRIDHGLFSSIGEGFDMTAESVSGMLTGLKQLILGMRSIKEMSGPVGIATMTGEAASRGLADFVYFLAYISLSLGIMNLLPIPVLDGGHLVFYALEAIRGKPLSENAQAMGFYVGLAFVLTLMVVVTFNDLQFLVS